LVNIYQTTWCNIPEDSHLKLGNITADVTWNRAPAKKKSKEFGHWLFKDVIISHHLYSSWIYITGK
jgi:hypothetical protein